MIPGGLGVGIDAISLTWWAISFGVGGSLTTGLRTLDHVIRDDNEQRLDLARKAGVGRADDGSEIICAEDTWQSFHGIDECKSLDPLVQLRRWGELEKRPGLITDDESLGPSIGVAVPLGEQLQERDADASFSGDDVGDGDILELGRTVVDTSGKERAKLGPDQTRVGHATELNRIT